MTIGWLNVMKHKPNDFTDIETTLELASHANTCVVGRDALIIHNFDRPMDVRGYDQSLGSQHYSTVSGVLKYIHPYMGLTYHLVINQAIHKPHLPHHLLCPMQCCINDVIINDLPKFLDPSPSDTSHLILCPLHNYDDDKPVQMIVLPLWLKGVTSYLNVDRPTAEEWTSAVHLRLILTSEHLTWDPHDTSYGQQEDGMTDMMGNLCPVRGDRPLIIQAINVSGPTSTLDTLDDNMICDVLEAKVVVASVDNASPLQGGTICTWAHKPINYLTLAKWWCIAPDWAKRTIDNMMQCGVCTCLYPDL